jgi:ankyrin repeat protein
MLPAFWALFLGFLLQLYASPVPSVSDNSQLPVNSTFSTSHERLHYDVSSLICQHLNVSEIAQAKQTCRHWNEIFQHNFKDPVTRLRYVQGILNAVDKAEMNMEEGVELLKDSWRWLTQDVPSMVQLASFGLKLPKMVNEIVSHLIARTQESKVGFAGLNEALVKASEVGANELISLLIERGQACAYFDDQSPLALATRRGHQDTVRLLLRYGASITSKVLSEAIYERNDAMARMLVELGADLTENGFSAVILAFNYNMAEFLDYSFDHGVPVNFLQGGYLFAAVQYNKPEMVKVMLKGERKDVFSGEDLGRAFVTAIVFQHEDIFHIFLENRGINFDLNFNNGEPLLMAGTSSHVGMVKSLLESGVNVNLGGSVALLNTYDPEVEDLLVQYGVDEDLLLQKRGN